MCLIEIGGVKVLYTCDYSLEDDRHLMAAETPNCSPDVLIVESTYGVQVHQSVTERESRFTASWWTLFDARVCVGTNTRIVVDFG